MNIAEFASSLSGREYLEEITKEEEELAAKNGWLVVFGYSDDNAELRGAIYEELGAWNGTTIHIVDQKLLEECECECKYFKEAKNRSKKIHLKWSDDSSEFCWVVESEIKHYSFEIFDENQKFCLGAVFDMKDL